jgi:FtsZ-interacting cell division protein ZipA
MSTGLIILIVVVVLLLIGLLVMLPRMRAKSEERKARNELESRRERVATEHRETASARTTEADRAEQEAEIAQQKARAQRAEAERHESEAKLHERGLADDQLVEDHERDRFAGVSGGTDAHADDDDGRVADDRPAGEEPAARRVTADDTADRPNTEYQQGREDEAEDRTRGT